jgi:integrase
MRWQLIAVNPAALVEPPPLTQIEVHPYNDEARRFLDAAREDRLESRWLVAIALGIRQGEALGLWWDDLDFEAGTLRVRRALQRDPEGGGLVFVERSGPRCGLIGRTNSRNGPQPRIGRIHGWCSPAGSGPRCPRAMVLGHSQISVTLNTYSHVAPELAVEAAGRMEGALWSAP